MVLAPDGGCTERFRQGMQSCYVSYRVLCLVKVDRYSLLIHQAAKLGEYIISGRIDNRCAPLALKGITLSEANNIGDSLKCLTRPPLTAM